MASFSSPTPQTSQCPHPQTTAAAADNRQPVQARPLSLLPLFPPPAPKKPQKDRCRGQAPGSDTISLPQASCPQPSPCPQLVPWEGSGEQSRALLGEGKPDPHRPFLCPPLPSAASISISTSDLSTNFHTPTLPVRFTARHRFHFDPQWRSFPPPLLVNFTPSGGQVQSPISRAISPSLPSPPPLSSLSPSPAVSLPAGPHLPRSALAAASLGRPGQCPAAAASAPATPAPSPPFPPRAAAPSLPRTAEGLSHLRGERRGRGGAGDAAEGRRGSLDAAARDAARGWWEPGRPPALPPPQRPTSRRRRGKCLRKREEGLEEVFISLCAGGWGRIEAARPGTAGLGAPR